MAEVDDTDSMSQLNCAGLRSLLTLHFYAKALPPIEPMRSRAFTPANNEANEP